MMTEEYVTDISVYKNGHWQSMRDQSVWKDGKWNTLGVGSGVYKSGTWHLLRSLQGFVFELSPSEENGAEVLDKYGNYLKVYQEGFGGFDNGLLYSDVMESIRFEAKRIHSVKEWTFKINYSYYHGTGDRGENTRDVLYIKDLRSNNSIFVFMEVVEARITDWKYRIGAQIDTLGVFYSQVYVTAPINPDNHFITEFVEIEIARLENSLYLAYKGEAFAEKYVASEIGFYCDRIEIGVASIHEGTFSGMQMGVAVVSVHQD